MGAKFAVCRTQFTGPALGRVGVSQRESWASKATMVVEVLAGVCDRPAEPCFRRAVFRFSIRQLEWFLQLC